MAATRPALLLAFQLGALAGCDGDESGSAQLTGSDRPTTSIQHFQLPAPAEPRTRPASSDPGANHGGRFDDSWTYAPSMQAFHQIWADRFVLSAEEDLPEDTLLPYADALAFQGASWGLEPSDIRLIVTRDDGLPYRIATPRHPSPDEATEAEPLDSDARGAQHWATVAATSDLVHDYDGLRFRMAGPIVAGRSCNACHTYPDGAVVGMLRYSFSEIPDD